MRKGDDKTQLPDVPSLELDGEINVPERTTRVESTTVKVK